MSRQEFYLIGAMAIVTFFIRYSLIAISGQIRLSSKLTEALNYLPPVILTAIVVPAVLMPTIVCGMTVFFVCQWLLIVSK